MAARSDVVEKLKKGYKAIGRTYKNHIDGFSLLPYITGKARRARATLLLHQRRRRHPGDALRQLEAGVPRAALPRNDAGLAEPFTRLRVPKLFNLRTDPYEFATRPRTATTSGSSTTPTSSMRRRRSRDVRGDVQGLPADPEAGSFTIDDAIAKMADAGAGSS
jgi:arylsulfatase